MLIIGIRFFCWGSQFTEHPMHCGQCGASTQFIIKQGMRFITVFFIIPVIPISGMKHILQCPNCGTRFQATK